MEKVLLLSHAAAGFITLIAGIIAVCSPKKLKLHRPAGKVFYYFIWYVVLTAFILSALGANVFLFLVGTLTFYTNIMGYRNLKKYQSNNIEANFFDWLTWVVSLVLLAASQYFIISKYGLRFDGAFVVINVFTIILLANLLQDIKMLVKKQPKNKYLIAHIGKMGGTFIAAITAALVQNVNSDPVWVAWLLPAVLVSPILSYFSSRVKKGTFWKKKQATI